MAFTDITEDAIRAQVETFYAAARGDALIGPVFEVAVDDWPAHIAKLCDFWSSVMLTTGRYHGRPLPAHAPLPLTPEMFERWLALWSGTARALFAEAPAAAFEAKARRIAESLSLAQFFRPEAADRGQGLRVVNPVRSPS